MALGQAPSVTSISPAQGPIAGGTLVTVAGANFQGASLSLDNVAVSPQSATATEITFVTPARNNGIAALRIATAGGNAYGEFLFLPPRLSDLPPGYITTVAGIGVFKGYHRPATQAAVSVAGIGFDQQGNIYLAEPASNRISVVRPNGILEPFAGSGLDSNFSGGNVGDGGPAAEATMNFPRGVTTDLDGTVYLADQGGRIRRVDAGTGIITTIAGTGNHSYSGDGGPAVAAGVLNATHITGDGHGTVFFTDFDDVSGGVRIRKITPAGIISTVAGNGTPGFSGDGGPATAAQFNFGFADYGDIALDSQGNLYVADTGNRRIRRVDGQTGIVTTFVGPEAPVSDLYNLFSVAVDASDNVYYSYNPGGHGYIVRVSPAGQTLATYGTGLGYSPAGTALGSLLVGGILTGLAIDPAGNVVYSDAYASQVRRLNLTTGFVETVAGVGLQPIGENGPALASVLSVGNGALAFLPTGELLIGDSGNFQIRKIDHAGNIAAIAGGGLTSNQPYPIPALGAFVLPLALQTDATGRIYLADANGILTIDPSGILSRLAGRKDEYGLFGDNGPAVDALLCQPWDFCRDGAGNIFIADTNNNRVRRVDAQTGLITTVAGSGPVNGFEHYSGNGQGSFSGDGGPAVQATLDTPHGVAVDTLGNLFIADSHNNRIRRVNAAGTITTFVDYASFPTKLAFDVAGNLYGVLTSHQLMRYNTAGVATRIAGSGAFGFAGDGGPAPLAELSAGYQGNGLAIDAEGNIFLLDAQNLRVRAIRQGALLVSPGITTQPSAASVTAGVPATFTVAANGFPAPALQWQVSTDGGSNWANVSNTGPYSGATTSSLTITGASAALNGYRYRVSASNVLETNSSDAGLLTVTGFPVWQAAKFTTGELADANLSGPNALFGQDGLPNLVKYALGFEPKQNITTGLPWVGTLGSDWTYTYTRPDSITDVTYAVEVSINLTSWTTAGVTHELVSNSGGIDTWRGRYPLASAANCYFRLKVTR